MHDLVAGRAWVGWVPDPYDENDAVALHASTRGQARRLAAAELGVDFVATRVRRVPELDGQPITAAAALSVGAYGWSECHRCYRVVHGYDLCQEGCVGYRGSVYCSRACCIAGERHDD